MTRTKCLNIVLRGSASERRFPAVLKTWQDGPPHGERFAWLQSCRFEDFLGRYILNRAVDQRQIRTVLPDCRQRRRFALDSDGNLQPRRFKAKVNPPLRR